MRIGSKLRFCYWIEVSSKAIKMRNDFSLIFFFPITSVLVLYTGILFGVTLELVHEGTFLFVRSRKCQKHRVVIRLHATCRFHRYEVPCIHPTYCYVASAAQATSSPIVMQAGKSKERMRGSLCANFQGACLLGPQALADGHHQNLFLIKTTLCSYSKG